MSIKDAYTARLLQWLPLNIFKEAEPTEKKNLSIELSGLERSVNKLIEQHKEYRGVVYLTNQMFAAERAGNLYEAQQLKARIESRLNELGLTE